MDSWVHSISDLESDQEKYLDFINKIAVGLLNQSTIDEIL